MGLGGVGRGWFECASELICYAMRNQGVASLGQCVDWCRLIGQKRTTANQSQLQWIPCQHAFKDPFQLEHDPGTRSWNVILSQHEPIISRNVPIIPEQSKESPRIPNKNPQESPRILKNPQDSPRIAGRIQTAGAMKIQQEPKKERICWKNPMEEKRERELGGRRGRGGGWRILALPQHRRRMEQPEIPWTQ